LVRAKNPAQLAEMRKMIGAAVPDGIILNPQSLQAELNGCDAVIHLVGIISEVGENTFENVHVGGTRNVVAAAREQGIKRFIHMSALGTRPNAVSRYHRTKWESEEIVRGSGLNYTIFRPSLIFGPRDMFVNLFAKIIRFSPIVPILGRRDARFQPVAIETVAGAFVFGSKALSGGGAISLRIRGGGRIAAARLVCARARGGVVRLGVSETQPAHANASARTPPTTRRLDNLVNFERRMRAGSRETGAEAGLFR